MQVRLFLLADAVFCALRDQTTPEGYYNMARMLRSVLKRGAEVHLCGTCAQASGIADLPLVEGTQLSTMSQLARWTVEADKVLVF